MEIQSYNSNNINTIYQNLLRRLYNKNKEYHITDSSLTTKEYPNKKRATYKYKITINDQFEIIFMFQKLRSFYKKIGGNIKKVRQYRNEIMKKFRQSILALVKRGDMITTKTYKDIIDPYFQQLLLSNSKNIMIEYLPYTTGVFVLARWKDFPW
jgi:hypothetical protein